MKRRVVLLVFAALAVAGGAFYWARRNRARGLVLTGIVTTDEVNVSSEIQGRLGQLMVKEGDPVRRNQLLAMIEPQELKADQAYYAHTEEGQTAAVHEAGSALKYQELQTRDQIRQAEAALASSQSQWRRVSRPSAVPADSFTTSSCGPPTGSPAGPSVKG